MGQDRPATPKRSDGFLPFSMPEVTYDISIQAAAAVAVSPHLYKNSPAPFPIIMDITQQNCHSGNGAISLKQQRISSGQAGGLLQRMW